MRRDTNIKIISFLVLIMLLSIGLYRFTQNIKTIETDHFIFELNRREKSAAAIELTELGKKQEVLVIPLTINKYPVRYIGATPLLGDRLGVLLLTPIQKKIYLPSSLGNRVGLSEAGIMDAILNVAFPSEELIDSITRYYETNLYYLNEDTKLNIFYMYNFESSLNEGYYFMDYINGSNPYVIPSDPVRKGYTFAGWYYEKECATLWNNEMPTSESEVLTLFAKWI
ncbi:MAG: hypothetical protein BWX74_00837 [Tenericutes bacterium ADurb.Bin087]|nr:MAG: hypothetical protein BWX74_00837 [Tenericutes bacterium ADurb.Bin087]